MALTREGLQQHRDPALAADTKRAAKTYLQQFMKIDPARMSLTSSGLVIN
jgi:hypothetical protein